MSGDMLMWVTVFVCLLIAYVLNCRGRTSRCLDGNSSQKGILNSSSLCQDNSGRWVKKVGYYKELLEDLHQMEPYFKILTPSSKDKIQILKLEVRYILPYAGSGLLAEEESYDETKRHFKVADYPEILDDFVAHMMKRTLLVKADATDFYCSASCGRYDWHKCTDYVLDNLRYVQSLQTNHTVAVKEQINDIEEGLRLIRSFCMLVAKWKFEKLDTTKAKIHDIYDNMCSMSRNAAYFFHLFMFENVDESRSGAMYLKLAYLQRKVNDGQQRVKEVYFEILELLRLCMPDTCSVKCETVYGFVDSLQHSLKEVSSCFCIFKSYRASEILEFLSEIEFLRTILVDPGDMLVEHGKLDAILTHIDVLVHEAVSVVSSSEKESEEQDNHEMWAKTSDLINKIKLTRHEIRGTNRKDVMLADCSIDDFLKCFGFLVIGRGGLELEFLRTFLRCTRRWCSKHPNLGAIRFCTANAVQEAWWELRGLLFKIHRISKKVRDKEVKRLLFDLREKLTANNLDIKEVCNEIRDLKLSSSTSPMSENLGLDFADALCDNLGDLRACTPEFFYVIKNKVDGVISVLGILRELTAKLCPEDKTRNDFLTHLEDLTERAACLSYLHLVAKKNQTMSLSVLLLMIEEPGVRDMFVKFIKAPVCELSYFELQTDKLMLYVVNFMIHYLTALINYDANLSAPVEHLSETLQRELILLKCILMDPLKQYSEQKELDNLLNDIGARVSEAGMVFWFFYVNKVNEIVHFQAVDMVEHLKVKVRHTYSKFAKLSLSMLPKFELGLFDILLMRLIELKRGKAHSDTEHQIGELLDDLVICSSFVQDNDSEHDEQEAQTDLIMQIMTVGCKVENFIDTLEDVPTWFSKMRLSDVIAEVKHIKEDITKITRTVIVRTDVVGSDEKARKKDKIEVTEWFEDEAKAPETLEEVMVGFENEEELLIKKLTTGSQQLEIVAIVGMPGLGKTTLAMRVYKGVADSFRTHAWCCVSQNYQKKELLQRIINQIHGPNSEINKLDEDDLAHKLYQSLWKKNYLIVLDDIWDIKAWNELKTCFPLGKNGSRILLTSRFKLIGFQASGDSTCIELGLLTIEKSWHLLQKKVFGSRNFPLQLCAVGEEMAKRGQGLPLSLVVIAGVLKNIDETEEKWKQVANSLDSLFESQDGVFNKLELSYNHLSMHMKQCFLYCGAFLREKEIPRLKLLLLWVAERFIKETDRMSLEDTAECCLRDLVDRSLLIVTKIGSDNRIRSCRIHDLLRDFCIRKAEEESFLYVTKRCPNHQRRICFPCLHKLTRYEDSLWPTPRTCSLMFTDRWCAYCKHDMSTILENFRLLKVLDLECIDIGDKFPESVTRLILLRFLAVKGRMKRIPSSIGELLNLQTLIVRGTGEQLYIPNAMFDLKQLRHLLVDDSATFGKNESWSSLDSLRSLSTAMFCSCDKCEETIIRLPNLQKLSCKVSECRNGPINWNIFPALDTLTQLESLKVVKAAVVYYPCKFSLPSSLKKLTLSRFLLPWSEMEIIAELPQLEVLKLHRDAFKGQRWDASTTFQRLKYLGLEELDIEQWETSYNGFPNLEQLVVRGCTQLKSIPSDFSEVETLKCIKIRHCSRSVVESAIEIENEQRNYSGNKQFRTITCCTGHQCSHELESSDEFSD